MAHSPWRTARRGASKMSGSYTQQSGRIFFTGYEPTQPLHACGPGVWPHYLLHYVLSGAGTFFGGQKKWRLSAGDAFLIIPGAVCSYISDEASPWEYCWVGFDGRDCKDILHSCGLTPECPVFFGNRALLASGAPSAKEAPFPNGLFPVKDGKKNASPGEALLSLNDAFHRDSSNTYLHLSLLYRFFSLLSPQAGAGQNDASGYIKHAVEYIQHNYAYDIKILDVARYLGIDRTYLYKLFSRELGISPQQYLINYRLIMAKQLLSSTALRVSEIANSCGFADSASFCHHFRAQFSITPTQFRRELGTAPVG